MSQSMANDELERVVDYLENMPCGPDGMAIGLGDPAKRMPWLAVKEDFDYTASSSTPSSASPFVKAEVSPEGKSERKSLLSQARADKNKRQDEKGAKEDETEGRGKKVELRVMAEQKQPQDLAKVKADERKAKYSEKTKAGAVVANVKAELSEPADEQKKSWLGLF